MRNTLLITFTLLTLIFGCKKSESTSPPPPPPNSGSGYTIKIGDTWWFHRWSKEDTIITIDTTKHTVVKETTFNINNKTIPAYVIVDSPNTSSRTYLHVSDSIFAITPVTSNDTIIGWFIWRLIRANVSVGDTWTDVSDPIQFFGRMTIKSRVKAVNVNENVPAGSFIVTKVGQDLYSDIWGYLGYIEHSINKDIIFVSDSSVSPPIICSNSYNFPTIKISTWYSKIAQNCDTTYSAGKLIKFKRGGN
jgi:hypothetical protein